MGSARPSWSPSFGAGRSPQPVPATAAPGWQQMEESVSRRGPWAGRAGLPDFLEKKSLRKVHTRLEGDEAGPVGTRAVWKNHYLKVKRKKKRSASKGRGAALPGAAPPHSAEGLPMHVAAVINFLTSGLTKFWKQHGDTDSRCLLDLGTGGRGACPTSMEWRLPTLVRAAAWGPRKPQLPTPRGQPTRWPGYHNQGFSAF